MAWPRSPHFPRSQSETREDITLTSKAFYQAAQALLTLAGQFDQVNQYRREAERLVHKIESLKRQLAYTHDPAKESSLRDHIHNLNTRKLSLEQYANQLEQRADQNAQSQFDEIADMCDRLHTSDSYEMGVDLNAPFSGTSKNIGNTGSLIDIVSSISKDLKGFRVTKVNTKNGYYIDVRNGHLDDIKG
jgi:DNA repair exonuclease SbcCD ATPase subunit